MSLVFCVLAFASPLFAEEAAVSIPTPRGVSLEAFVDRPDGDAGAGPRPVVVFAPGQGYDRTAPLAVETARGAAARGWIGLRFDWAYWSAGRNPSTGLADEREDLAAAIAHARSLDGADAGRVVVVAKSLGTVVAVQDPAVVDDLAGLVLLTPPIGRRSAEAVTEFLRDQAGRVRAPLLVVTGDRDPICPLAGLYAGLATMPDPPRVVVVGGDHGLEGGTREEGERQRGRAVRAMLDWIGDRFETTVAPEDGS